GAGVGHPALGVIEVALEIIQLARKLKHAIASSSRNSELHDVRLAFSGWLVGTIGGQARGPDGQRVMRGTGGGHDEIKAHCRRRQGLARIRLQVRRLRLRRQSEAHYQCEENHGSRHAHRSAGARKVRPSSPGCFAVTCKMHALPCETLLSRRGSFRASRGQRFANGAPAWPPYADDKWRLPGRRLRRLVQAPRSASAGARPSAVPAPFLLCRSPPPPT